MKPKFTKTILQMSPKVSVESAGGDAKVIDHKAELVPSEGPHQELPKSEFAGQDIAILDIPKDMDFDFIKEEIDFNDKIKVYEGIVKTIEKNMPSGVSQEAATLINLFAEKESLPVMMYVSNESYSVLAPSQTEVALEGFKEAIRDWWQKFREWLKGMGPHFEQWTQRVVTGADRLVSRSEIILNDAENRNPGDARIVSNRIGKLAIGGKVQDVPNHIRDLANICRSTFADLQKSAISNAKDVAEIIGSVNVSDPASVINAATKINQTIESPVEVMGNFMKKTTEASVAEILLRGNSGIETETFISAPLLGNCTLAAVKVTANVTGDPVDAIRNVASAIRNNKLEFLDESEESKKWNVGNSGEAGEDEENEFPRLSVADCRTIADSVKVIGETLKGIEGIQTDRKAALQALDRAGSHIANVNPNVDDESQDIGSVVSSLKSIIAQATSRMSGPSTKLASYFGNMARISLEYAEKSLTAESTDKSGVVE